MKEAVARHVAKEAEAQNAIEAGVVNLTRNARTDTEAEAGVVVGGGSEIVEAEVVVEIDTTEAKRNHTEEEVEVRVKVVVELLKSEWTLYRCRRFSSRCGS